MTERRLPRSPEPRTRTNKAPPTGGMNPVSRLRCFSHCLSFPLTHRRVSISGQQAVTPL